MCGICGILRNDQRTVDRDLLERMNEAIHHRGPDGDGYYYAPGVGLAMRRLAIIDLKTGDQPISNEDESVWIVFNGEIFNFPELRIYLHRLGHHFRTQTDTECIVHLYEQFGEDCVNHLRGQFAFALWDQKESKLLLARDRMGQIPLYYALRNGCLHFSSELPSLLLSLEEKAEINLNAIDLYLSLQYIPEPNTPYSAIFKLPAACRMVFKGGEIELSRYWQLTYEPKHQASEEALVEELREIFAESVRIRMISDVPLGAHLSGGIDSSIIVALMAENSDFPVKTFSIGFQEDSFSELPFARRVAERYGTDHHEFTLTYDNFPETLEHLVGHIGEPFADPSAIPLYYLSKLTREFVTVALNGDGGDEAFAGYQRYWLDPWANLYTKLPGMITDWLVPNIAGIIPDKKDNPAGRSLVNGIKRLETIARIDPRASILRWGSYFSPAWKSRLWRQPLTDLAETFLINQFEAAAAIQYIDRTLSTDVHTYLPGDLLLKADRMTMISSLEGRSPFLDHKLASWAARLPVNYKVKGSVGKYILRRAFIDKLPNSILQRGKQGFGIPVGDWFRGPLSGWVKEILFEEGSFCRNWFNPDEVKTLLDEHLRYKENHGKRIYALLMLNLWSMKFPPG
jgi:asparagine synthase (glutamine-hydrolysing)